MLCPKLERVPSGQHSVLRLIDDVLFVPSAKEQVRYCSGDSIFTGRVALPSFCFTVTPALSGKTGCST
jgi:hypothetical protein